MAGGEKKYSVFSVQYSVNAGGSSARDAGSGSLNTDALNTEYFSPFPRRRLSAEETRDSILAVTGAHRNPALPDMPTAGETVKGFEAGFERPTRHHAPDNMPPRHGR